MREPTPGSGANAAVPTAADHDTVLHRLRLTLPDERSILLERDFLAPRALVWEALTRPEHLTRWWGPRHLTAAVETFEFREGGAYRFVQRDAEGRVHPFKGVYREIRAPERIVMTEAYDVPPFDQHVALSTLTLTDLGDRTRLTSLVLHASREARDGHVGSGMETGAAQSYDRLGELLAVRNADGADDENVLARTFDAPRELVFRAWTEPERLAQWWGPKGFHMHAQTLDLRPGGMYHYGMRGPTGALMWGKFVYREIASLERLAFVTSFSDEHGATLPNPWAPEWPLEVGNTLTFHDLGERTLLLMRARPVGATAAQAAAFAAARANVQQGFAGTFAQLDAYLGGAAPDR